MLNGLYYRSLLRCELVLLMFSVHVDILFSLPRMNTLLTLFIREIRQIRSIYRIPWLVLHHAIRNKKVPAKKLHSRASKPAHAEAKTLRCVKKNPQQRTTQNGVKKKQNTKINSPQVLHRHRPITPCSPTAPINPRVPGLGLGFSTYEPATLLPPLTHPSLPPLSNHIALLATTM